MNVYQIMWTYTPSLKAINMYSKPYVHSFNMKLNLEVDSQKLITDFQETFP